MEVRRDRGEGDRSLRRSNRGGELAHDAGHGARRASPRGSAVLTSGGGDGRTIARPPGARRLHVTPLAPPLGAGEVTAWRLDESRFAATWDSGEGARLYGGRWNSRGRTIVYCSVDPSTGDSRSGGAQGLQGARYRSARVDRGDSGRARLDPHRAPG